MQQPQKRFFIVASAVVIIVAAFSSGIIFGFSSRPEIEKVLNISSKETPSDFDEVDFEPFWKAWRLVESRHVGDKEINRQDLVWGAIEGMVASLGDPYTVFLPPVELDDFESEIKGEFSGIGAEIGVRKDVLTIIAPLKGSPAEKAGLKAGDRVLVIDETFTNNLTLDEAVHIIRGERGTKVKLTVRRNGEDEPREIEITRDVIRVPNIIAEKETDDIFRIQLFSFSQQSARDFSGGVRDFLRSGATKLIVDVRNNPGGFFQDAVEIASWWLPEGEVVAREEFRDKEAIIYRSVGFDALIDVPTVILVNRGSASASEILAGALQEHGKAVLIGETTFGKGSVQQLESVTRETSLKITIAKWTTPNGISISKAGLPPDIEVEHPADAEPGDDPQLDKAIDYLQNL